jgi:alkylated DNA repair dioxygenase AlkB
MDLFAAQPELLPIPIEDGELSYMTQLPLDLPNAEIMLRLLDETAWKAETIFLFGKETPQPRLSAWYGEKIYSYSGRTFQPLPFTPLQLEIKRVVEAVTGREFNSVLLNYYRDGNDSMGFHSDDEPELGREPAIASVSFGDTRTFILKHKKLPRTLKLNLTDGSLLLMAGKLQNCWRHGINKERSPHGARINLTFRCICG